MAHGCGRRQEEQALIVMMRLLPYVPAYNMTPAVAFLAVEIKRPSLVPRRGVWKRDKRPAASTRTRAMNLGAQILATIMPSIHIPPPIKFSIVSAFGMYLALFFHLVPHISYPLCPPLVLYP